jgi:hypothetical protein
MEGHLRPSSTSKSKYDLYCVGAKPNKKGKKEEMMSPYVNDNCCHVSR